MVELIDAKTTDAKNFVIAAPYAKSRTTAAYRVADDKQTLEVAIISGKSTNSLYQIPGDWEERAAINDVCAGLIENSIRNDFNQNPPADKIETFKTRRPDTGQVETWERRSRTRTDEAEDFAARRRRDEDEAAEYEHTEIGRIIDGKRKRIDDTPFGLIKSVFDKNVNRVYVLFQRPNDKESFEAANDFQKIYNLASLQSNRAPEFNRAFVYSKSKSGADFWDEYAYLLRPRLGRKLEIFLVFPGNRDRWKGEDAGDAWNYASAVLAFRKLGLKPRLLELDYQPSRFRFANRRFARIPKEIGVYSPENFFEDARKIYGDSPRTLAELFDEHADFYSSEIFGEDLDECERFRALKLESLRPVKITLGKTWLKQGRVKLLPPVLADDDKEGAAQ